jgi:hypothetical protein
MRTSRRTKPRSEFVFSQGSCSGSLSFRPYGAAGSWWAVDPGRRFALPWAIVTFSLQENRAGPDDGGCWGFVLSQVSEARPGAPSFSG